MSMYKVLLYFDPLKMVGRAFKVALMALLLLPTRNAPPAPPPIIKSSNG